jgi:hypothetical protein
VRLEVGAFPLCVQGKSQRLRMAVNGTEVAAYEWPDCEPWKTSIEIPANLVHIGFNDLTVTAAFAEQPPQDPRQVSLGFSQLKATAQPEN